MLRSACRAIVSRRRFVGRVALLAALAGLAAGGCATTTGVALRSAPKGPLVDQLQLTSYWGPQPSQRTMQVLRVYNLDGELGGDTRKLLEKFQVTIERDPAAENIYAYAELAYLGGKKVEKTAPQEAVDLYGAAVLYAHQYLFGERFSHWRNPYDPQFRGACDLYNGALEGALRIASMDQELRPGHTKTIRTAAGAWDITCVSRSSSWRPEDFDRFEFVSDYEIKGLQNQYRTHGLGVPLIAVRRNYAGEPLGAKYYPPGLGFPVTAFFRPDPNTKPCTGHSGERRQGLLELYDPLTTTDTQIGNRLVPLEADLTTPLAYFLSNPQLQDLATVGLLHPEVLLQQMRPGGQDPVMGLYMVQPYEPGKIPVVFIHGLWSSPMTWMAMFNDLRSSPEIRANYQFWFYLYPTGQPFWISAAQMRRDLAEVRLLLDPRRAEPSLDAMVLVGHSMGGLVARLQTINSNHDYWGLVSRQPLTAIKAEPEVLRKLQETFYFQPNPSVRRVVTISTPHRGSKFSNETTQWLLRKLITLPQMLVGSQQKLFRDNTGVFPDRSLLRIENSIDSLAPNAPVFPVMLAGGHLPWVKYHNIIGLVPYQGWLSSLVVGSDGVVSQESAHLDNAASEMTVPADHTTVHSHPLAVLEVRRILLEHLAELRGGPGDSVVPAYAATRTRIESVAASAAARARPAGNPLRK